MKEILFIIVLFISMAGVSAQTIRKPWSELTSSERSAYVNAINGLSGTTVSFLADEHNRLGNMDRNTENDPDDIHDPPRFLPWHRFFIGYMEDLIQQQNSNVTIPYWDWYDASFSPWDGSETIFSNSSGENTGLLGYNISSSVWNYTRYLNINNPWSPPSTNTGIENILSFSNNVENGPHNSGHSFVGGFSGGNFGTMGIFRSPNDPIFYLHHAMVDKLWADWYNLHPGADVSQLDANMVTLQGLNRMDARTIVNPRVTKIWYAKNGILLLNIYETSGTELYNYTTGYIDAENFTVKSSSNVEFRTVGQPVYLNHDFVVETGAVFVINTN